MVAKIKNEDKNWEKLVNSLKKGIAETERERKAGKKPLTALEVICSHEDIERTRQGWKNKKR